MSAISVRGLHKSYGDLEAVRGVDFDIEEGEVFGLLGPNGAGKTTTVEILEGYRRRDAAIGRGETVVVVGHQPDCSKAVAALTGGDEPAFPPCAHALVDID